MDGEGVRSQPADLSRPRPRRREGEVPVGKKGSKGGVVWPGGEVGGAGEGGGCPKRPPLCLVIVRLATPTRTSLREALTLIWVRPHTQLTLNTEG